MTIITVNAPKGRLSLEQRREPAGTPTDAVLVPEVGQLAPAARVGFQVHFVERERDMMAIGGRLPADAGPELDVRTVDVAVMDAAGQPDVRAPRSSSVSWPRWRPPAGWRSRRLPGGSTSAMASASDNWPLAWPLAWRLVAPHLHARPGARVLVVARGSIGL